MALISLRQLLDHAAENDYANLSLKAADLNAEGRQALCPNWRQRLLAMAERA